MGRQGEMALFHPASGRWADRHFVLTKAGFLHWVASMEELEPLDCLNLSRCQFESSQDAQINIAEQLGGKVGPTSARPLPWDLFWAITTSVLKVVVTSLTTSWF